ncbi:MAG TPA: hypothetical protein VK553_01705 [Candidatus Nitrosopolaris rasttigaisensis]|nr:hypothetical protein [Candidatus Nitrosopolaris rasttigaisensis]
MFKVGAKVKYITNNNLHALTTDKIYTVIDPAVYNLQNGTFYTSTDSTFLYGDDGILNGWVCANFELAIEQPALTIDWFELNRSVI